MAAVLGQIFKLSTSTWDEGIVASAYLGGFETVKGYFDPERESVLEHLFVCLRHLPESWARELSLEVLSGQGA